MPTTLPRHSITETAEVADALEKAALRWQGEPPAKLITLVLRDWASDTGDGSEDAKRRSVARAQIIGALPGSSTAYNRADDWPA